MKLNIKSNSNIHFTKNNFLNSYLNNFIDNENTYELIKYPCFEHDPRLLNDAQSAAEYILKTDKKYLFVVIMTAMELWQHQFCLIQ